MFNYSISSIKNIKPINEKRSFRESYNIELIKKDNSIHVLHFLDDKEKRDSYYEELSNGIYKTGNP